MDEMCVTRFCYDYIIVTLSTAGAIVSGNKLGVREGLRGRQVWGVGMQGWAEDITDTAAFTRERGMPSPPDSS